MATSPWHHSLPMRLCCVDHVTLDRKLNTLKVLRVRRVLVNCHYCCERARTRLFYQRRPYCVGRTKDNNGKQQSNKIRFRCRGSEKGKVLLSSEDKLSLCPGISWPWCNWPGQCNVGAKFKYGRTPCEWTTCTDKDNIRHPHIKNCTVIKKRAFGR
jgi:hypothetical protein